MNDLNWKTWALIFVVALGITFEAIKRLPKDSEKWTADKFKLSAAHSTPYQVKYKPVNGAPAVLPMNPQARAAHAAGLAAVNRETIEKFLAANKTHTSDFKHDAAPGADAKAKAKKKKDDGEWEIVVDPKTGKRYKRRKKKKIAKVEEAKVEVAKEEPKKEEEPEKEDDIDVLMNEAIAGGNLPPVGNEADSPHADLEEWKRRLLQRPDAAETRRFIEHYKNGIVTAEIFYKIVALMLEDSRPQMKELGVLCAGLTPSVTSFQVLAEVLKEERSGSSLRKYSESFLSQYSTLGQLSVLQRIMRAPSSPFLAVQATKRLDAAANNFLAPSKNKPPKNPSASTAGTHSNSGYFKPFVSILQGLVRNPDSELKEQARMTLANLEKLMNPGGSAPATVTPPTQASLE